MMIQPEAISQFKGSEADFGLSDDAASAVHSLCSDDAAEAALTHLPDDVASAVYSPSPDGYLSPTEMWTEARAMFPLPAANPQRSAEPISLAVAPMATRELVLPANHSANSDAGALGVPDAAVLDSDDAQVERVVERSTSDDLPSQIMQGDDAVSVRNIDANPRFCFLFSVPVVRPCQPSLPSIKRKRVEGLMQEC